MSDNPGLLGARAEASQSVKSTVDVRIPASEIPDEIMQQAAAVVDAARQECIDGRFMFVTPTVHGKEVLDKHIARALMDAKEQGRLEERERYTAAVRLPDED